MSPSLSTLWRTENFPRYFLYETPRLTLRNECRYVFWSVCRLEIVSLIPQLKGVSGRAGAAILRQNMQSMSLDPSGLAHHGHGYCPAVTMAPSSHGGAFVIPSPKQNTWKLVDIHRSSTVAAKYRPVLVTTEQDQRLTPKIPQIFVLAGQSVELMNSFFFGRMRGGPVWTMYARHIATQNAYPHARMVAPEVYPSYSTRQIMSLHQRSCLQYICTS